MLQPKLISVQAVNDFKLVLEYENNEKRLFDVTPYINGSWYAELNDLDYFKSVSVLPDGSGITWKNGQDIAPHELYELSSALSCLP